MSMTLLEKLQFLDRFEKDTEARLLQSQIKLKALQNAELGGKNVGETKNQVRLQIEMAQAEIEEINKMKDEISSIKTTDNE